MHVSKSEDCGWMSINEPVNINESHDATSIRALGVGHQSADIVGDGDWRNGRGMEFGHFSYMSVSWVNVKTI